jgi:hypothetical protein
MPRTGSRLVHHRTARLLLPAVPAAILVAAALIALVHVQRALTRATRSAANGHQLAFTLRPLETTLTSTTFEPVAAPPAYTTGAFFAGSLFLAGPSGLTILAPDGSPQRTLRTGIELPVAPIVSVTSGRLRGASGPQLLLATAGAGLLLLDTNPQSAPTIHQLLAADAGSRDLTAALPLATGDLLLGTRQHGVLVYNGASLTPLRFTLPNLDPDPAKLQVTALAAVDAASFLIGTRNSGVIYLHAGTAEQATALPDNQVEAIIFANRHAYIGTPTGTADLDLDAQALRPARILAAGVFSHTLAVSGGQLTIGTLDQGIRQIPLDSRPHLRRASIEISPSASPKQRIDALIPAPETLYTLADGNLLNHTSIPATPTLTDRNISALAFAPDGTLYIGFFDRGLDQLTPQGVIRHLEDDHLFCIDHLVLDPARQTIAAATANGLVLFDAQGNPRQTLTRRDGLIADHVSDIAFTPTGTALATPAGITFLTPTGADSLYASQGLVNNHVYALAARPGSSQLLAGTLGGLSILQSESIQRNLTVANSGLKHNWITALLPASNDTTLVGTYGAGLESLDAAGRFTPVELPAGTPRDLIINPNALYATPTHLYAGTLAHGLLVYSNATGRWSNLTAGLPSLNVTAFAARAGELYIGTENGLVRIPEANLP